MAKRALTRISAWPIAAKLTLVLLAVALGPMSVTTAFDVSQAREGAVLAELGNLGQLARSTAGRLDQLLDDTRRVVAQVAGEAEVGAFLRAGPGASAELRASVDLTLANVVRANDDIASAFLLDTRGLCVVATRREELGLDLSHRAYFQRAVDGEAHVSEVLTGSTSKQPGVYFSRRVDADGKAAGVAVVKLRGEVIDRLVGAVHPGSGGAFLVDGWGVVVAHREPRVLYHSLAPLPPDVTGLPDFEQRFTSVGVARIEPLGLDDLARGIAGSRGPISASFEAPGDGALQIAGLAPLAGKPWHVVVHRPRADLREPLGAVTRRLVTHTLFVAALVALLAALLARNIVRPLRRLTEASRAILRGELAAAHVEVSSADEIGALSSAFNTMADGLAARERELEIFGRMVSPEVREELLRGRLELGGETRRAAVLFSDIRGFSTLAETMDPHAVVALLNEYLTAMTEATAAHDGYINNFIGDAIVVVFGAPVPQDDAEVRAVRAAVAMRRALADLNRRREARGDAPLDTGIGVAVGDMVAGQIGSPERMLYTVIGDAVNVAARLESLTKDYPGKPILVTRRVADALSVDALGPDAPRLEPLGPVKLKGRAEPVEVVAVLA